MDRFMRYIDDFKFMIDLPEQLDALEGSSVPQALMAIGVTVVVVLLFVGLLILIFSLVLKLNKRIFRRLERKHGKQLQFQFMEKVVSIVLFVVCIILPLAGDDILKSLLGSTAVIAAIVGIAAQDVLKDMFSGLHISFYKPFDIADRIELE
ncbi:MAG: mechanosensitive ion channel, partial [Oscillospiraceae bacterium]|nr:mechanosensitive ion channel [Oscillospiraceae bacterium]